MSSRCNSPDLTPFEQVSEAKRRVNSLYRRKEALLGQPQVADAELIGLERQITRAERMVAVRQIQQSVFEPPRGDCL